MAGVTIQRGVSPNQWKTILVLLDLLDGNLPALDGVALLTVGAKLTLMNIGVAVGAFCPHVRKHRFGVTLRTGDLLVHAT